jgi:hypothetical protein
VHLLPQLFCEYGTLLGHDERCLNGARRWSLALLDSQASMWSLETMSLSATAASSSTSRRMLHFAQSWPQQGLTNKPLPEMSAYVLTRADLQHHAWWPDDARALSSDFHARPPSAARSAKRHQGCDSLEDVRLQWPYWPSLLLPLLVATGKEAAKAIVIGADCWIGGGAIILPGVTIGDGSTIGAGSVVTRDVPPRSVAVGNPARVVKTLPAATEEDLAPWRVWDGGEGGRFASRNDE